MSRSSRNGFTIIELLVIIGIIVVLIALFLPATRKVGEAANRMQCVNNLKQLMIAVHGYESMGRPSPLPSTVYSDAPAGNIFPPGCIGPGTNPEERLSWVVAVLPYLEQDPLYKQIDLEKGYQDNFPAVQTTIKAVLCPASKDKATDDAVTHYVAMSGIGNDAAKRPAGAAGNGFMGYDRLTSLSMIKDGTSNTIALMETRVGLGSWARGGPSTLRGFDPADLPVHGDNRPFGGHPGGMNVALADASVKFISPNITVKSLAAAITIADGDQLGSDW